MEQLEEETAAEVLYEIRHHANGSFCPDSSQKQTTRGSRVGWLSYLSHHGISQLRDKWDGYKRSGTSKRRHSLFVSPSGEHVAVAIGNQIIILQKDDEYMEPCGVFFSNDKLTAFDKGAWLEPDGILGIVGDDSTLYFIKSSGEEITRRTKSQLKLKSPIVDMIVSYSLDSKSSCLTGFLIFTANGLLHHVDIAQELSTSIYPSSQLTKGQIPHQVSCVDFHPDLSLLVLVGAPPNSTDSTGSYYLYILSVNTSLGPELLFCSPGFEGIFSDSNDCSSLIKSPKVAISMKGKYVATLDLTGCVDIFHLDVKKHALSPLYSVKGQDQGMSSNLVHGRKKYLIDVIDMSWWDDHVLVLANKNGVITMYDVLSGKEFSENDHTFSMPVIERVKHCEGYIFLLEATQQTSISEHEGSSNMHDNQQIEYKDYSQLDTSQSCWSLMSFSSRSVSQVYALLIKNGKYHAALDFAGHHGLDRDETFKAQWLHSDQTPTDIDMCLSKIKDQNFVLSECINKVGPTEEFVKALLSYGLQITDKYKFSDSNETDCHLIWDFRMFRLQLLQYRERLETFVGINMGRYQAQEYAKFRGLPLIESAMSLAESGKIGALNLLVKRHPYSLSPGILDILSSIPETIPVQTYSQLLPGRSPPTTFAFRDADWIECEEMVVYLKEVMMGTLVASTENIMKHSTGLVWPSTVELSEWYKKRARDIDNLSGQLDNSLALVEFACRKGVIELQQFFENISYLHQLIYSDGVYEDFNMSLVAWEHLSDYEKFRMMLKGVKEDKIVDRLREKAIPFMRKHLYYKTLDSDTETEKEQLLDDRSLRDSFLVRWLKEIAAENKLEVCFAVIENGCGDSSIDGLFKDEAELIETTLQCIYACSLTDQWNMMASILSKLPQKILRDKSQIDAADNLEKRIKITEGHVEVGRLLAYYQVSKPISFFLDAQSDEKNVKQLLRLILSKFGRRQPGRSDHDWANMWRDMQCFQEKAFPFLELEYMLIEFIRGLLKAGKFSLARNYLKGTGSITLASEKTENLVIQAAREYFFSAPSLACTEIWKAKECLSLLPNYKNVQSEADLIDALTIRLPNLGVTLLPMQFRQIKNPMEIINMAISSQNGVYVNVDELIEIAKLLGLGSPDEIAAVEEAIAREAAVAGDLQLACDLCLTLAKKGHGSVWDLCAAIARGPELGSMDTGSRKKLLGFALSHCDEESVGELLNAWKDVDMQCQYAQLITLSGTCPPNFSINNSSLISLPIHSVEDILNLRAASELLSSPCHENWVGNEIDFQRVKGTLPDIGRNLCVEDGISWESLLMENKKVLAFSALELPWLQELSRTEKHGKQATPELKSRSGKPRISISTQALLTVLCWMAENDIAPNDDLIASLAKSVMEPPVTEEEDVLGCSFLLNLVDAFWGVGVIEEQLRSREVYHELFSIMNIGMTYSSLHNSSAECSRPDQRRELLLQKFHENHASLGSDDMDQIDQAQSTFWREWKMKLEKQKQLADQARALEQLIPGIETARFLSGDTKYIKSAVFSFIDSIKLKKKHILKDAVLLADIYGLRRTEVLLQFFASALVSEHWETDDILAEISEYREDIVACAKEVIDMISDVVYPEIEGHNKRRLSYIYSILSACCLRLRAEDLASAYLDVGQIHMLEKFQFYKILEQECQKVSFINELNFKNIAGLNDLNFDHFNEEICSNIRESTVGVLADMVRTLVGIYSDSQARGLISWQTVYKHYVVSLLASLESKHIDCANPGELCTLITETAVSYDSCKKYVRVLSEADAADIICRFCKLCIQCSFSDSLKDESAWKNCLIMLLNLWIKIAQDLTETASDETFSEEPISFDCKYLSGCLNVFKRLLMEGEISVDQGWRAISSYSRLGFAFTSSNDISVFCEAMIFSGCGFQLVAEVYYESELSSASLCSHGKELNLVDLYIKLADGILSGFSRGEPERQKLHFLLSSISRSGNKHMDDLKIIRHEVWKKLSALSDNMQLESDVRVYALELMQSISGNNVKSLPVGLASEIRPWEAWDDTHWKKSSASIEEGDIPSSITSNLVALRSTQLAAAISPNIKISPEDLLTLDAALSCFLRISEFSTTLEDLNVLQAVLKEWEELFSSRVEKEKTSEPLKELNNWGNDDWDEGWEDLPEEPDRRDEKQNRSDSILPLHKCWMEIVKRLVGLSRLDAVVELLDRSLLKHEGALLDEDDTHSLFQLVVGIDCLMALKMMLLLPYKAPQVQCMHILESNLKDGSMPTAPVGDDNQVLMLVLSSGVLRDAAADPAFSKVFSYICYSAGCLARLCQEDLLRCTNNRSKQNLKRSLFFCKVLFPYFIAELVNAGLYILAGSCVSQWMHTPTSLSLINIVEASLRRYLEGQVLQAHTIAGNELNLMELDSCGSLAYTASCLRDKLGILIQSALSALPTDPLK